MDGKDRRQRESDYKKMDWIGERSKEKKSLNISVLFGYIGIHTLQKATLLHFISFSLRLGKEEWDGLK